MDAATVTPGEALEPPSLRVIHAVIARKRIQEQLPLMLSDLTAHQWDRGDLWGRLVLGKTGLHFGCSRPAMRPRLRLLAPDKVACSFQAADSSTESRIVSCAWVLWGAFYA